MQNRSIPAMAVLVIRHGRIVEQAATGVRAAGSRTPVTLNDVWHIGSDTKAMTATVIARLVERGTLFWQTPLSPALPELADTTQPPYRTVTMIDVFAHRAGFKDLIDIDFYNAFYTDKRPLHEQRLSYLRMALAQPPAYPPGSQNLYSNRGPLLAATIAERATGLSFETLLRRELFDPWACDRRLSHRRIAVNLWAMRPDDRLAVRRPPPPWCWHRRAACICRCAIG